MKLTERQEGEVSGRVIGTRVRRKEDPNLLTGRARYAADYGPPGTLHMAVLRSPHAHARVLGINTDAARSLQGVVAVLTRQDLPADLKPIPLRLAKYPLLELALQYPLAGDRVRYVGDPLALVVADSRYIAEDALELIEVEYGPLTPVTSAASGLQNGGAVLHEALGHNEAARFEQRVGDAEAVFRNADVVLDEQFETNRQTALPMETRGLVAEYDAGTGVLTVWGAAKVPHFNRKVLSDLLGMPEHRIRFIELNVGGGFGARGEFYPEDFLVPFLARRLGRPIKWVEDRREHLTATNHSRQQSHHVRLAATRDGIILAFSDRVLNDHGAYVRTHGATVPEIGSALLPGPYRIPHFWADVSCVLTNKTPTGTYRGPGRYEGTFVRERAIDMLARRLGIDPAELRLRNMLTPAEMPCDIGTKGLGVPTVYDSGDYPALLKSGLDAVGYETFRQEQKEARKAGRYLGVGIGCFVEKSGLGPWEYARVEVDNHGKVVLYTGISAVGQGMVTVMAQIVADGLSVPFDDVSVVYGDTDRVPFGNGAFASRGTVVGGSAALLAAQKVGEKARMIAARVLECAPADLEVVGSGVQIKGCASRRLSLGELSRLAVPGRGLPPGMEPGLSAVHLFETDHMTYPAGAHVCTVEVDPATGQVTFLKYAIAYDVGRAINPTLVEGQLQGGLGQGIGGALLEELAYDETGQLLTGSLMDYLPPTASEVPDAVLIVSEDTPSPLNPLGAKGAGEGGCTGAGGAIANAVNDALAPFGVEIRHLPISPDAIRRLLRAAPYPAGANT